MPEAAAAAPQVAVPEAAAAPQAAVPTNAIDEGGSELPEDVPCWSVTEDGDVFSNFVLLENVCSIDAAPGEDASEDSLGDGDILEGALGDGAVEDDLGEVLLGEDVQAEVPTTARVGWRCAVQTGRLEMFASTGRPPALLPNDEVMVLLRFGSQEVPVAPEWQVRAERDAGLVVDTFIVYEGLWLPGPADDHDRAGLPISENDFPLVGIQDDASKTLPEHENTTRRSHFDQREAHAQHAPHLVHAPDDITGDALRNMQQDGEDAVLHISIGSTQVTFDLSGWEDHIAALDPCGRAS